MPNQKKACWIETLLYFNVYIPHPCHTSTRQQFDCLICLCSLCTMSRHLVVGDTNISDILPLSSKWTFNFIWKIFRSRGKNVKTLLKILAKKSLDMLKHFNSILKMCKFTSYQKQLFNLKIYIFDWL